MEENIKEILKEAVHAPSGDNSQPWKFGVRENKLYIIADPEADSSIYDFKQRGSLMAYGALLENIQIISPSFGLSPKITIFPNESTPTLIAKINFENSQQCHDPLRESILKRTTNRKPYSTTPFANDQLQHFKTLASEINGTEIEFITDQQEISKLARILSLNERLLLENRIIHDSLFSFIRWTKEEEEDKLNGLYIKTLELAPPQEKAFKLFRNWSILSFFNTLIKVSRLVAKDSTKLYASSPAFGLIMMSSNKDKDFIMAGMLFQRLWLTATKMELALQPTTALLYLNQRIASGNTDIFTLKQINMIKEASTVIRHFFRAGEKIPVMLFRIGKAEPPSAHSKKSSPFIIPDNELDEL